MRPGENSPTFILAHGSFHTAKSWDMVRFALDAMHHNSIAVDLPIGDQDARLPDFAQMVREAAEGIDSPTLVGHSWGSNVVAWAAGIMPVEGVIHVTPSFHKRTLEALERPALEDRSMPPQYNPQHEQAIISVGGELVDYDRESALDTFYNMSPDAMKAAGIDQLRVTRRSADQPVLPAWPLVPTGLIGARYDQAVNPEWLEYIAKNWLGIKVEWLEQSDHAPMYSQPQELARLLVAFSAGAKKLPQVRGHRGEVLYWTPSLDQPTIRQHYSEDDDPSGVRFKTYEHTKPLIDIHEAEVFVLERLGRLSGAGNVVFDAMSSKAAMHARLARHGFDGIYVALDYDLKQLQKAKASLPAEKTLLLRGDAATAPLRDHSIKVKMNNMGAYHLTKAERLAMYRDDKRALDPEGLLIYGLSGELNKYFQRLREIRVGKRTKTLPPPPFNIDFPTEVAEQELHENFPDWYSYWFYQRSEYAADTVEKIADSLDAQRTTRKLHRPIPPQAAYERALAEEETRLLEDMKAGQPEVDIIHRAFCVLSRVELDLPKRALLTATDSWREI